MDNYLDDDTFRKPEVSMVVEVVIDEHTTYKISVGEATQSFKWLAAVVTNKRGKKKDTVVSGFRNMKGELINPKDKLIEHSYQQQLTVTADIIPCVPIDEHGDPVFSDWMQVAYVRSDHGLQWHDVTSAWRHRVQTNVTAEMENSFDQENNGTSLVQIGDLTEKDLESAFSLDWNQISVPGTDAGDDTSVVRSLLRQYYGILCKIFTHYAGHGQVGHRFGMSMLEFGHFLHVTRLVPYGCVGDFADRKTAFESIFLSTVSAIPSSKADDNAGSHKYPLMSRPEFMEGILQALLFAHRLKKMEEAKEADEDDMEGYGGKHETKAEKQSPQRKGKNVASIPSENVILIQLQDDLVGYLEVNVMKHWVAVCNNSLLYSDPDPEVSFNVREVVYHLYQIIKQAYLAYSTVLPNNPQLGPGISFVEFENMLEECSLLDSTNAEYMEVLSLAMRTVTTPAIDSAFNHEVSKNSSKWGTLSSLCFSEVLDCIMKLSVVALDQKMDVVSQVKLGLNFVAELQSFGHK